MEGSKIGFKKWMVATFLMTTSLKSVSSMKLHRDIGVTQKTAWFMAHRLRVALSDKGGVFSGPVEVDETYFGGRRKNMSNAKRKELAGNGSRTVGKTAVIGAKDRETNQVAAQVIERTDAPTLQGFVREHAAPGATVYSDEAVAYEGIPFEHKTVKHSLAEYVKGDVHTNGIESLWAMLKRAHTGTFHKLSPKHLDRYVQEVAGRHNLRELDTINIMFAVASGMEGKRLRYRELIADNGWTRELGREDAQRASEDPHCSERAPTNDLVLSSYSEGNDKVFPRILDLYVDPGSTIADVTYGKGVFWRNVQDEKYDLRATDIRQGVDCRHLPYPDGTIDCVVLDPPYMHSPGGTAHGQPTRPSSDTTGTTARGVRARVSTTPQSWSFTRTPARKRFGCSVTKAC